MTDSCWTHLMRVLSLSLSQDLFVAAQSVACCCAHARHRCITVNVFAHSTPSYPLRHALTYLTHFFWTTWSSATSWLIRKCILVCPPLPTIQYLDGWAKLPHRDANACTIACGGELKHVKNHNMASGEQTAQSTAQVVRMEAGFSWPPFCADGSTGVCPLVRFGVFRHGYRALHGTEVVPTDWSLAWCQSATKLSARDRNGSAWVAGCGACRLAPLATTVEHAVLCGFQWNVAGNCEWCRLRYAETNATSSPRMRRARF